MQTTRARKQAAADDGAARPAPPPGLTLSFVIEWDNARLADASRARRMLAALDAQCRDVLRNGAGSGVRVSGRPEILIVLDPQAVDEPDVVQVARECLGPAGDVLRWRTVARPGHAYFELKNEGATHAGGDLVVFLDSDVIPDPGWLRALLAPFAAPEVQLVAGATYVPPSTLYSKTVALTWLFALCPRDAALVPVKRFWANNVAWRRRVLLAHPYTGMDGETRGACDRLARDLVARGIQPYRSNGARVRHPAPNGALHYLHRAVAQGRDQFLGGRRRGSPHGRGLRGALRRSARRWTDALRALARSHGEVGLRPRELPAAAAIVSAYCCAHLAGGVLAHWFPRLMRRRFRL